MANNLVLRILSAIILAPLVIYTLYLGGIYLQLLSLFCLFLMLYEWFSMNKVNAPILFVVGSVFTTTIALANMCVYSARYIIYTLCLTLIYGILTISNQKRLIKILTGALLALIAYMIIHMILAPKPYGAPIKELMFFSTSTIIPIVLGHIICKSQKEIAFFTTGIIYILTPMLYAIFKIAEEGADFLKIAIWILVVVWSCDIFAYFGGKLIGGAKLAPSISPKKTWSGAIVSSVATLLIAFLIISKFIKIETSYMLVVTVIMIIASILGDLLESKAKRMLKVKDSGNIIPGHGGVLDRLDSLLMVIYVFVIAEVLWYFKLDLKMLLTPGKWI